MNPKFGALEKTDEGFHFTCYLCKAKGDHWECSGKFTDEDLGSMASHLMIEHPEHYEDFERRSTDIRKRASL